MAKRTRKRNRQKPPPTPQVPEADQTELDLAELAVLWPRLDSALARDAAGPSAAPTGSGGGEGSPAVINLDVEQARARIAMGVDELAAEVERLLKLDRHWRPCMRRAVTAAAKLRAAEQEFFAARATVVELADYVGPNWPARLAAARSTMEEARRSARALAIVFRAAKADVPRRWTADAIEAAPDWYVQLRNRKQPLADHIAKDVQRWVRTARSALRLSTGGRPLGWLCPHHRDKPSELWREADEARLSAAVLAGRAQASSEAPLTWQRSESVRCSGCKERWSGVAELRVLMLMIEQADKAEKEQETTMCECGDELVECVCGDRCCDDCGCRSEGVEAERAEG